MLLILLCQCFSSSSCYFACTIFAAAEYEIGKTASVMSEELLFLFPVISLISSPSKYLKGAATDLLVSLEKILVKAWISPKNESAMEGRFPSLSTPGSIAFRLLKHLWFQVPSYYLLSGFFHLKLFYSSFDLMNIYYSAGQNVEHYFKCLWWSLFQIHD